MNRKIIKPKIDSLKRLESVLQCITIVPTENDVKKYDNFIKIEYLFWDDWNLEHIKKHNISKDEVEESLSDENIMALCTYSERLLVLGETKNRFIATILSRKEKNGFYVVTARDMSKKERKIYANAKK